jgi:hypothetical protein
VHVGEKVEGGVKTIEERIAEAIEEHIALALIFSEDHWQGCPERRVVARRILARAEKRLADLEAVRDRKAVEVWATASVAPHRGWAAFGAVYEEPRGERTLERAEHEDGLDRITVMRAVAYLPVETTDEVEAEASDV